MYKSIPALELAIAAAEGPEGAVMRDRERFAPFFRAAEEYAHAHGMIVGGAAATRLLRGDPPGPSDYYYELYSDNALTDARALADLLYSLDPEGLAHYTTMSTRVPRKEFEIAVDERPLFLVKALAVHRGARAADIVVPSLRPASFALDAKGEPLVLQCMGPEIQLIDMYSALTDPSRAGEWGGLIAAEEKLRALFEEEVKGKIEEALSGGDTTGGNDIIVNTTGGGSVSDLIAALLQDYVPRSGHALIGALGAQVLAGTPGKKAPGRLQLVTANTFQEEEKAVLQIAGRMGYNVQSTRNEPKVPTDDRLRRMTMYVIRPGERREPFLDIYNSGDYQLVAYLPGKRSVKGGRARKKAPPPKSLPPLGDLPVGTPFTVLRFLLVDAWTIQLLYRMDVTSPHYTRQVLREIVADFSTAADAYLKSRKAEEFGKIFPDDYIGRFQDPIIHAKRERHQGSRGPRQRQTYFPPYYPAARR